MITLVATTEQRILEMVVAAGFTRCAVYKVSDVALIIGVSSSTVRQFCDRWTVDMPADGLECYRIGNKGDRRIPFHALVDWLRRTQE